MLRMAKLVLLMYTMAAVLVMVANGDADATTTPSKICNVKVSKLAECLPAITGKSPPKPTKSCCSVIENANLRCFCNYKSEFAQFGVDPANAMALPKKCGRKLPRECKKTPLH